ncbi:MAG TPA: hypothetical protein VEP90_01250 [Methylomirabilota bacterium]|nr:hypothetical protein [Methylomirabilota bacterium]
MPRVRLPQSSQHSSSEKALCIVDTCSLVYMDGVELVRKPLQKWLWEEFNVRYSEAVLNELTPFQEKMSVQENWEKYMWRFPNIGKYESAIFSSHQKKIADVYCNRCKQTTWKYTMFTPSLLEDKDRGERHNCSLVLHAILEGHCSQVIFLTDDLRAQRDYTAYFFDVFPIGTVWSLLDFITYLFLRHRNEMSLEDVRSALRDVNAVRGTTGTKNGQQHKNIQYEESEKKVRRLKMYYGKVERMYQIFSQI